MTLLAGNNSVGAFTSAVSVNHLSGERAVSMQYVASAGGTAQSIYLYANRRGAAEAESVKLFITNSSGALLAISAPVLVGSGGAGWISGSISDTAITSGQTYYIGFYGTSADGRQGIMSSGSGNYISADGSYTSPADPISWSVDGGNPNMAMYADGVIGGDQPTLTDVDTDEEIDADQLNVIASGTDFDTATVEIRQSTVAVEQSIDSQDGTAIQFDVVFDEGAGPHLKYGAATLAVINEDEQEDTIEIVINPPSGKAYVDIDEPNEEADNRITAVEDIESGDQLEVSNVQGEGVDIDDVSVFADGTFEVTEDVTSFDVRVWDVNDSTWGAVGTQSVGDPDNVPDAFDFNDVNDAALDTEQTSDPIEVSGINVPVAITVSGGEYSINGGEFTASPGTVENGDEVRARHTSSSSYSTAVNTTVTIGGVSDTFTSTTIPEPEPPVFAGPISNISVPVDEEMTPVDLSAYFAGADEFDLDGTLPEGVSFDAETGVVSGTPTEAGTFGPFVVTGINDDGEDDSNEFYIVVTEPFNSTGGGRKRDGRRRGSLLPIFGRG